MSLRPFLLAGALAALAACGDEPARAAYEPGSALESLYLYNDAMRALDEAGARAHVLPGVAQAEFFEKKLVVARAIQRFHGAVREAYGEEGLRQVLTSPGGQQLRLDAGLDRAELDRMRVQQQGDVAFAHFPTGGAIRLERRGGTWYVDVVGSPDPAEVERAREQLDFEVLVMAQALDRLVARLQRDEPELTAFEERFDRELERALAQSPAAQPAEER